MNTRSSPSPKTLKPSDFVSAASSLDVSVAAIRAIAEVEAVGTGFMDSGHPDVLFERHVMYKQLREKFGLARANALAKEHPDIVNPVSGGYGKESAQPKRLERAAEIDRECALNSASWGLFQIMGYHWRALGYATQQTFINAMYKDEGAHLFAFCRFIKINPALHMALKQRDWVRVARLYNGPNHAKNNYAPRMAAAYNRIAKEAA